MHRSLGYVAMTHRNAGRAEGLHNEEGRGEAAAHHLPVATLARLAQQVSVQFSHIHAVDRTCLDVVCSHIVESHVVGQKGTAIQQPIVVHCVFLEDVLAEVHSTGEQRVDQPNCT